MAEIIFFAVFGAICACSCAVIYHLAVKLERVTVLMEIYKEIADEYMEKTLMEVMGAISDPKYYQGRAEKQEE